MHSLYTCCLFVPNIVMSPDAFWADWTGNPWLNPRCWRHLPEAAVVKSLVVRNRITTMICHTHAIHNMSTELLYPVGSSIHLFNNTFKLRSC